MSSHWSAEMHACAWELREQGLSMNAIAREMVVRFGHKCSKHNVSDVLRRARLRRAAEAAVAQTKVKPVVTTPAVPPLANYYTENIHFRRAPIWTPPASIVARSMIGCSAAMAADAGSMP